MNEFEQAQARGRAAWESAVQAKRVAIYGRISTKDKGQDVDKLAALREFCERQGWPIVHEYVDHVSGKRSDNRPEFQALFTAASRREFDMVLFWSLDRFSREGVLDTLKHLERLDSYGVAWKSFTEQYLDSCGLFKDAVLSILATIAKQERIRISERVHAGLARVRAEGKILGRPRAIFDKQVARDMLAAGGTYRTVAAKLGVSTAGLHGVLNPRKRQAG
jgi:DNA invertase Pin-like site-specific DNA recombinase